MGEKADLRTALPVMKTPRLKKSKWRPLRLVALLGSIFAVASLYPDLPEAARALFFGAVGLRHPYHHSGAAAELCPQSDALYPDSHAELWKSLGRNLKGDAFTTRAVEWLGGAVRIWYVSIH